MHYSVVIPFKDEEDNIQELIVELEAVMQGLKKPWELIAVDDGSTDGSLVVLQDLIKKRPHMRILTFTSNFGQSAALSAGFKVARGEFIITLDGDRQNDPADIPKLTAAIRDCDLVVGWRVNRRDPWKKRIISRLANGVRSRFCLDGVHDSSCSLKVYRKKALQAIKMYRGMHRFLPALFKMEGFRVKEIPVNHRERVKGTTKYHFFNRLIGPIIDMFVVRWMHHRSLRFKIREEITHK